MKGFCIIGDTHFGARGDSNYFHDFFDIFYSGTFFPYLLKNNIKTVIQVGDSWDRRKYTNHNTIYKAKKSFYSKFDEYGIDYYTLVGNHDMYFKESVEVNTSELLLFGYKHIHVIKTPTSIKLDEENSISLIPWICEENYQECIDYIQNDRNILCAGHFEIQTFKMYQGGVSAEHGLDMKLFSNYEHVFSGHYHHKSTKGNITYVGTPYEMTWQDYGDIKGFHYFNTTNRKLKFIENPNSIFVKVEYDDSGITGTDSSYLDESFLDRFKDKYVKIHVTMKTNPYLFDLFIDAVNARNPIDVNIIEEMVDVFEDSDVDESDDTLTIVNKYIDTVEYNDLDKVKLKGIMSTLYSEALMIE